MIPIDSAGRPTYPTAGTVIRTMNASVSIDNPLNPGGLIPGDPKHVFNAWINSLSGAAEVRIAGGTGNNTLDIEAPGSAAA